MHSKALRSSISVAASKALSLSVRDRFIELSIAAFTRSETTGGFGYEVAALSI